jgi:hypothetical protein
MYTHTKQQSDPLGKKGNKRAICNSALVQSSGILPPTNYLYMSVAQKGRKSFAQKSLLCAQRRPTRLPANEFTEINRCHVSCTHRECLPSVRHHDGSDQNGTFSAILPLFTATAALGTLALRKFLINK